MRALRLAVALAFLIGIGCRTAETQSVRIDPVLSPLIPSDTSMLAGIRVDALRQTPVYQKWIGKAEVPGLDRMAQETGVDPRRDIGEVLFASDGAQPMLMARGNFSKASLQKGTVRGAKRIPYKAFTLIGTEEHALVFLNPSTAVLGPAPALRKVIDQRSRSASPEVKALLNRVSGISDQNQVWFVSTGGFERLRADRPQSGNAANFTKILSMVESLVAAADFKTGLNAHADGICRSAPDAKSLADAVRGFIGLGRLTTPEGRPDLLRAYDAIKVDQADRTVRVSANMPEQLLDQLIQNWRPPGR